MALLGRLFIAIYVVLSCAFVLAACAPVSLPSTTVAPTSAPLTRTATALPATALPTVASSPTRIPATVRPTSAPTTAPSTPTPLPPTLAPTAAQAVPTERALAPTGVDAQQHKAELLALINRLRAANACQPLQFEARLQQAAQSHAEDMRDNRRLDHTSSGGATLRDRLDRVGYPYQRAGENITNWFKTPQDVMAQWTEGPEIPDGPHRKNVLNCAYTEVGIGLAYRDDGVPYWVLDLANQKL